MKFDFFFNLIFFFSRTLLNPTINSVQNYSQPSSPQAGMGSQSGRGASVVSFFHFSFLFLINTINQLPLIKFLCVLKILILDVLPNFINNFLYTIKKKLIKQNF